ncbi:MAG: hypothetical protein M1821_008212 [Bathelium mastoideum]|nr:MAG: hypothetical protein M1821_008212 [Bathelium mastoideum]
MSTNKFDAYVKGPPPPDISPSQVAGAAAATTNNPSPRSPSPPSTSYLSTPNPTITTTSATTPLPPTDPLSTLPSSPPQIYLNLLILEASLRAQYLTLRARRRRHLLLLSLLGAGTAYFAYLLVLRPRDDGSGRRGGSVYWVVELLERIGCWAGALTLALVWATGVWERGVRWPRRWVGVANRGLRGVNAKVVVLRGKWWGEVARHLWWLWPLGVHVWGVREGMGAPGSEYRVVEREEGRRAQGDVGRERDGEGGSRGGLLGAGAVAQAKGAAVDGRGTKEMVEEDVAPGGDYIKLLLLPKPFSPDFRENWELYRTEYWERENERRANLRTLLKRKERELAKKEGGWLWWTGWRGWDNFRGGKKSQPEQERHHVHGHAHSHHLRTTSSLREKKRRPSVIREGSHSRSSSKSNTPTPELDDEHGRMVRRGSGSGAKSNRSRRKSGSTGERPKMRGLTPSNSRPGTPNVSSTDTKRLSTLSVTSESGGDEGDSVLEDRDSRRLRGVSPIAGTPIKPEDVADD